MIYIYRLNEEYLYSCKYKSKKVTTANILFHLVTYTYRLVVFNSVDNSCKKYSVEHKLNGLMNVLNYHVVLFPICKYRLHKKKGNIFVFYII